MFGSIEITGRIIDITTQCTLSADYWKLSIMTCISNKTSYAISTKAFIRCVFARFDTNFN